MAKDKYMPDAGTELNAVVKLYQLKEFKARIEALGYSVITLQDGTLEVADPVRTNGSITTYSPVRLYRPIDARKFVNERS